MQLLIRVFAVTLLFVASALAVCPSYKCTNKLPQETCFNEEFPANSDPTVLSQGCPSSSLCVLDDLYSEQYGECVQKTGYLAGGKKLAGENCDSAADCVSATCSHGKCGGLESGD